MAGHLDILFRELWALYQAYKKRFLCLNPLSNMLTLRWKLTYWDLLTIFAHRFNLLKEVIAGNYAQQIC